jgi:hypothetical protein
VLYIPGCDKLSDEFKGAAAACIPHCSSIEWRSCTSTDDDLEALQPQL